MKISSIGLVGFRSHIKTKVADLRRINIFVGPNGAGKSTLLDAIGYALTGITRGVDEGGRGADGLVCQLSGAPKTSTSVSLQTDKGEIIRGIGQGPKSQAHIGIVSKLGLDQKVMRVLSAPTNLLRLPNKKQEEVFFSLTGAAITPEAIAAALTEAGIDLTATPVAIDELMTPEGRATKLAYWKDRRVEMKREIQSLVFTPSDQELPEADEVRRRGLESEATNLSREIARGQGAGEQARQSAQHFDELIEGSKARMKALEAAGKAKPTKADEIKKWRAEIDAIHALRDEKSKKAALFSTTTSRLQALKLEADRVKALGQECSACGQEISKAATDKKLAGMRVEYEKVGKETTKLSGELKDLDGKIEKVDINALLTKINQAERSNDDLKRNGDAIKAAAVELADLQRRRGEIVVPESDKDWSTEEAKLADLQNQVAALKAAEVEAGRQLSVNTRRSEVQENLDLMEKMLTVVGPGGAIQQAMASGGTEEMMESVRAIGAKLGVGDIGIKFGPWQITLNGRDVELASASEEFRVAAAFGIAFAKRAGASMVCLDGAEILRGENRDLFQDLLFACDLEQIFVAFASDSIPECFEPVEGLAMFSVTKDAKGASTVKAIKEGVPA